LKLRPVVNLTNILGAAFGLIIFHQKITKPNCNKRKAGQNTFVQKSCLWNVGEIDTWRDFGPAPVTAASSVTEDMRRLVETKSELAIERWFRTKLNLDIVKIWLKSLNWFAISQNCYFYWLDQRFRLNPG